MLRLNQNVKRIYDHFSYLSFKFLECIIILFKDMTKFVIFTFLYAGEKLTWCVLKQDFYIYICYWVKDNTWLYHPEEWYRCRITRISSIAKAILPLLSSYCSHDIRTWNTDHLKYRNSFKYTGIKICTFELHCIQWFPMSFPLNMNKTLVVAYNYSSWELTL